MVEIECHVGDELNNESDRRYDDGIDERKVEARFKTRPNPPLDLCMRFVSACLLTLV